MAAEAKTAMRRAQVSPDVDKADKKFFKKDFPWDKRPKADDLHFKHPYPVVQDSNDYDKDFIKDENSDNGAWKAQETYDRLRVKLNKEKKDLAKALKKKQEEEGEMQDALAHHDAEERERIAAQRRADELRRQEAEEKRNKPVREVEEAVKKHTDAVKDIFIPKAKSVDVSTEETEKALDKLENCKKELAKARQQLKDLMSELEEAKKKQASAEETLHEANNKEFASKEHQAALKKTVKTEYDEYQDAREAYLKQQALVHKLEADIKVAAAKVKAIRDSSDKDGGVYPSHDHKSAALSTHFMWAAVVAIATSLRA